MGFSGTASHAIWAIAIVVTVGTAAMTTYGIGEDVTDAAHEAGRMEEHRLKARLGPVQTLFTPETGVLSITLRNDGLVPLDPEPFSFVLDGNVVRHANVSVTNASVTGSHVWLPGEDATFTFEDQPGGPHRVHVMTGHGVARFDIFPPGPLAHLVVVPSSADVPAGESQTFEARGYDAMWVRIYDLDPDWTTNAGTITKGPDDTATLDAQTTAEDGRHVTATVGSLSASAVVNVVPGPMDSLQVSPTEITLAPGATWQFTAEGVDQYGNTFLVDDAVWDASGGVITQDGLYTAPATQGTYTVGAEKDGERGEATVTVSGVTYASTSFSGTIGTVANADAYAREADAARLTEEYEPSGVVQPVDENDRTFEGGPLSGNWVLTSDRQVHLTREMDPDDATNHVMQARATGGPARTAWLEYAWENTDPANDVSDVRFRMQYTFSSGVSLDKFLRVRIVTPSEPDGVLVYEETLVSGLGWVDVDVADLNVNLSAVGQYAIQFEVGLGGSDFAMFDNIALTWTRYDDARFDRQFDVPDLPRGTSVTHTLEVRASALDPGAGTPEGLEVWTEGPSGVWTYRGTLDATTATTFTRTLTADEVIGNSVHVRLIDATRVDDAVLDAWDVEYVRVTTTVP